MTLPSIAGELAILVRRVGGTVAEVAPDPVPLGPKLLEARDLRFTLVDYLLRKHVVPRFGSRAVGRITASEVPAWLADLHRSELSPNTVAKAYRASRARRTVPLTPG